MTLNARSGQSATPSFPQQPRKPVINEHVRNFPLLRRTLDFRTDQARFHKVHLRATTLGVVLPHRFPLLAEPSIARSCFTRTAPSFLVGIPTTRAFVAALFLYFSYPYGRSSLGAPGQFPRPTLLFRWRKYASTENPFRAVHRDFASWCGVSHRRSRCRWRQTPTQTASRFRWRQALAAAAGVSARRSGCRWRQTPTEAPDITPNCSLGDTSRGGG
jgi:hypothetical protein